MGQRHALPRRRLAPPHKRSIKSQKTGGAAVVDFPSRAIGKRLRLKGGKDEVLEIVGVARQSKCFSLVEPPMDYLYRPLSQNPQQALTIMVETAGPSSAAAGVAIGLVLCVLASRAVSFALNVPGFKVPLVALVTAALVAAALGALCSGAAGIAAGSDCCAAAGVAWGGAMRRPSNGRAAQNAKSCVYRSSDDEGISAHTAIAAPAPIASVENTGWCRWFIPRK